MADPLAGAAIRHGHRELLVTLREFAGGLAEPGDVRGLLAFLRHELLPFSHREEALLAGGGAPDEGAAFEHAFLAAEIDALAGEARRLESAASGEAEAALAAVRRRVHRLEALLELHAARGEDEEPARSRVPAPRTPAEEEGGDGDSARTMGPDEVRAFLAGRDWGVLATAAGGRPYAVPVSFGWDGRAFFLAMRPGRKLANLRANPAASLTVLDVEDGDRWRSVVVSGPVEPVAGVARVRALDAIRRQRAGAGFSAADLRRAAGALVFRLAPEEVSGRARG